MNAGGTADGIVWGFPVGTVPAAAFLPAAQPTLLPPSSALDHQTTAQLPPAAGLTGSLLSAPQLPPQPVLQQPQRYQTLQTTQQPGRRAAAAAADDRRRAAGAKRKRAPAASAGTERKVRQPSSCASCDRLLLPESRLDSAYLCNSPSASSDLSHSGSTCTWTA